MKNLTINSIALAFTLAFSAGAMAEGMSKADYKAGKDKISADFKTARASCDSLSGNASDICAAEAKGNEKVALAELQASYKPSQKTRYEARLAKADAVYDVAKEKCDDLAGNGKDVCLKEAKAAETAAKADAKAQMKVAEANATAGEKTAEARSDASKKGVAARQDATADKSDAQYAVAKEKCDTYSGAAKDSCLDKAKLNFNK